jgi:L-aspartate oxidase
MENVYLKRRYLVDFEAHRVGHIFTDVLIIGGGAAGLRSALEAARYGQVLLITKGALKDSNTSQAQGGIAAVLDEQDSLQEHIDDTLVAGADLCDEPTVRYVVSQAPQHIRQLVEWGAAFDRAQDHELDLTREGGHGRRRIVHAHGDATGHEVSQTLIRQVQANEAIKVFEQCFAIDLMTDPVEGGPGALCLGAITWHERYGLQMLWARQVILATGGAGVIWRETTNPALATADGHAMAFRAGVTLADMEMMQFHPTTLYIAGASRSLVSEAVRGEGAYLVDKNGYRFMGDYHEDRELAPRDVVARAILSQMARTGGTHVSLDVRHLGRERFAERFPRIYQQCLEFDIDPGTDLIPVRPAAHYMIGGARVDLDCRTDIHGLLACGESSCTGLHGANRLGSNSLIEAMVFGQRCGQLAGEALAQVNHRLTVQNISYHSPTAVHTELDILDVRQSLRSVMWRNAGLLRSAQPLSEAIEIINFWCRYVLDKPFNKPDGWEMQNMLQVARLIATTALARVESRGAHYREDFPQADPAWRKHQLVRRTAEELVVSESPVK